MRLQVNESQALLHDRSRLRNTALEVPSAQGQPRPTLCQLDSVRYHDIKESQHRPAPRPNNLVGSDLASSLALVCVRLERADSCDINHHMELGAKCGGADA